LFATSFASRIGVQNGDIEESIATSIGSVASKTFISSPETPLILRGGFVGALHKDLPIVSLKRVA
jgi:hypothetical protein